MNIEKGLYRINNVKIDDLLEIYQIETASYIFPWSMQSIKDQIIFENAYNRTITINNNFSTLKTSKIVGYIFGYTVLNDLYITNICIHPNFLRKKLASALLENLFNNAKNLKCKSIFLEVRKSNTPAKSLYKKFHFIEDGERKNFYSDGESAIMMHKEI